MFRDAVQEVQAGVFELLIDSSSADVYQSRVSQPKDQITLDTQILQSVLGPILRIYAPNLEDLQNWNRPFAELIK